ncbi:MAG: SPFH domain-containing protein, partial [Planctomycetia bacterium]
MKIRYFVGAALFAVAFYVVGYELFWKWGVCRRYVDKGESLLVMYRGNLLWGQPPTAESDFVKTDAAGRPLERGYLREMVGPGRHFQFDPFHYVVVPVPDVVIPVGQVGVVVSNLGKVLPEGEYLVEGDVGATEYRGLLRKVLKPGRYRINTYGYKVTIVEPSKSLEGKRAGWVEIPSGYVGVVTNLAADKAAGRVEGIQSDVLQPGLYAVNPREQQIDVILVGYQETSIMAKLARANNEVQYDENGEPMIAGGASNAINFPSSDGFPIVLDYTAIWGILPEQAPKVVGMLGARAVVETNIIIPEIESICRIHGSKLGAVDLLVGESREQFQSSVSNDFKRVLDTKELTLQVGLVRHIHIPTQVRGPIQKANIAEELRITRDMEIETAKVQGALEEARSSVVKEEKTVVAETEKLYQEAMALGRKEVEELAADTQAKIAAIGAKTAAVEAKSVLLLGAAEADVTRLMREAESQRFKLAVDAFGTPEAYNQWVFASNLPDDMKLNLMYAGQGTFWTDLKGFEQTAAARTLSLTDGPKGDFRAEAAPIRAAEPSPAAPPS